MRHTHHLRRANKRERDLLIKGFVFIVIIIFFVGKVILGFHLFSSFFYLFFMLSFFLVTFAERKIKKRIREEERKMLDNKKAMNLYLGCYKKS